MAKEWQKILDDFSSGNSSTSNSASSQPSSTQNTSGKSSNNWQGILDDFSGSTARKKQYDDAIAPVASRVITRATKKKEEEEEKKEKEKSYLKKGALENGITVGSITKAILGTISDVAEDVTSGFVGAPEAIWKGLSAIAPYAADAQFYQNGAVYDYETEQAHRKAMEQSKKEMASYVQKDFYNEDAVARQILSSLGSASYMTNLAEAGKPATAEDLALSRELQTASRDYMDNQMEDDSVFGQRIDELAKSGGQMLATKALGGVVPWQLSVGLSAMGSEVENGLKNGGATYDEAVASGAVSAAGEVISELISGGINFGSGTVDDAIIKELGRVISNKGARTLAKLGVDMAGEGAEEILSGFVSALGQKLTYADEKELRELFTKEDAWEAFVGGAIMGGTSSAFGSIVSKTQGIDPMTEMTKNEQAVVDKVYKDRVVEAEKSGKLTQKEKSKIYDSILEDMEKGYISIDTIEEVLGGEKYNQYKQTAEWEDSLQTEFDTLNKMKQGDMTGEQVDRREALREQIKNVKATSSQSQLRSQIRDEVMGLVKGDRLIESYNERTRRGQFFEADLSKYDSKQQATIQKAIDSGILNNTNRTHEFVDIIAKISADKGVLFDFTNNAKLKESGFAVDGKQVNGFVTNDGITLNIDSPKAWQSTVGHEITHVLEGTELYTELQNTLIEYAKSKGDYQGRYDALTELYKDVKDADINAELTADLVGEYLFADEDFINNLSSQNRNVFQKIYDEIKYLCKIATAGSKEARELEKVKRAFEKAYREGGKTQGDTKYSLSDSTGKQLTKEQQEYFKDSKMRDENGNLKVMYHGSQDAGFHVFDSSMSDDGTSFFFVDRNDVAASYSGTSETYEAKTIRTAEDMNNFLAEIGYDQYEAVEKDGKIELLEDGDHVAFSDTAQGIYEEFCWYEGVGEGDANYKVYLNLKNPLEVDAEGRNWNNISREFSQEVYDKYKSLTDSEKTALAEIAGWGEYSIFRTEILEMAKAKGNGNYYDTDLASAYEKLGGANANLYDAFSIASDDFSEESLKEFAVKQMNTRDYAQKAKAEGYDGVIFKNIVDVGGYGNGDEGAATVAIALYSNQIKSVANAKPTADPDIRYSLSDSNGRELSKEQSEYFKDSKVRDENGRLQVMYHGSPESFTVFDKKKAKSSGLYGKGFYFTNSDSHAKQYGNTYEVYLNITNPLQNGTNDITKDQLRKFVEAIADDEDYGIENYGYEATVDSVTSNVFGKGDFAMLMDINVTCVGNMVEAVELFNKVNGTDYNGIIAPTETVAFYPEQIKNIDNKNPTSSSDIRFSLSDNDYLDAVNRGDMEAAQQMVNAAAKAAGYSDDMSWKMQHTAPNSKDDISLVALKDSGLVPKDYWDHPEWYTYGAEERESFYKVKDAIRRHELRVAKGKDYMPTMIWVYRAVDKTVNARESTFRNGDWVTPSRAYAENEGQMNPKGYRIIKDLVPIKDLYWDGNSIAELGYDDGNSYAYADTKNNRKLLDPVTYDDAGNVIPLSKRFKKRVDDARYSLSNAGEQHTPDSLSAMRLATAEDSTDIAPVSQTTAETKTPVSQTNIAPTVAKKETVAEAPVTADDMSALFPDNAVPEQAELEQLMYERDQIYSALEVAVDRGTANEVGKLAEEYEALNTRIKALESGDSERTGSLTDTDVPPEMDAPYVPGDEDYEGTQTMVDDPFEQRDIGEVGKQSVKAYQYENPEVKPFFQEAALGMLYDVRNTTRGEKWYNDELYYATGGEQGFGGTKRHTTDDIAELKDAYGYTYEQIENGLNAIIEDDGKENNAVSKRIEFMLNDRLLDGYTDVDGRRNEPNQGYIKLLNEKQITEYSKESFDQLMANADQYAPSLEESYAPILNSDPRYEQSVPGYDLPSGQQSYIQNGATYDATPTDDVAPLFDATGKKGVADGQQAFMPDSGVDVKQTRKEYHQGIIDNIKSIFKGRGFDFDKVLKDAKNLSTWSTVDNTPQRVMEKALGYKEGGILADITVNKVAQNESEGIKWLNSYVDQLKQISKQYGIKPGSKESAAAQMYAEGFYVNDKNEIVRYGDAELIQDFGNGDVSRRIKALARDPRIRKIYDDTLAKINESRTRNLYPEIPRRDNYFLHFRAMEDTFSTLGLPFNPNDIRAKDLPTDLNGVTADLKPGQPYFSSAMHRKGKRTSFDLLGGVERYLNSAKNQIYHIDDIQTLRALRNYVAETFGQASGLEDIDSMTDAEAEERIKQVYGSHLSTFAKFLNEEANVLAGKTALIDRGLEGIVGRRGMTLLNTLKSQVGSNMVGGNVSSSLTNFMPVAQTFAKANKFDFTKAFAQTVANKLSGGKFDTFAEDSPVVIRRKGSERFAKTPWQKLADPGYVLMSAVDDISTEIVARTKYNEFTRKGMDSQKAHFETDKWVSKLMGDRSLGQQPHLYNSKLFGILTQFQLEVRNQLDMEFYDTYQEAKASSEQIENALLRNAKTAAKTASTIAQLTIAQHLYGKAFEAIAGYNPAFDIVEVLATLFGYDDEEDSEDTMLDNLSQALLALAEDMPYASTFTGGRIPISAAIPDVNAVLRGEDEYGNEIGVLNAAWEEAKDIAPYYIMPTGYGQLKKTTQGLKMFSDDHPIAGSYTDSGNLRYPVEDTVGSRIKAGIFGQYASENAQKYFDQEQRTLNPEQTEIFASLNIPIEEYWDYRDNLYEFYDVRDRLKDAAYADGATDEDVLRYTYINNVYGDIYDLYDKQKELASGNSRGKTLEVRQLQKQMEQMLSESKFGVDSLKLTGAYAEVGGVRYNKDADSGRWYEIKPKNADGSDNWYYQKEQEVTKGLGISYEQYWNNREEYNFAYDKPGKYAIAKAVGGYDSYMVHYDALENWQSDNYIAADKDSKGNSISGSRKEKVIEYINGLDLDYGERLILYRTVYSSKADKRAYNMEIINYLNERDDISYGEMKSILEELDMEVDSKGNISW